MKVRDVMESDVKSCGPDDTLESSALMMWNHDCGSVPVLDANGTPIGILTDRDIAMASALNHKPLWDIRSREVTNSRPLYTCNEKDDIRAALEAMQAYQVRRLPVINDSGQLKGIISIDDIVACSEEKNPGLSYMDTMNTLKAVCIHH